MRKVCLIVAGAIAFIVVFCVILTRSGPNWEVEFIPVSLNKIQLKIYKGETLIKELGCSVENNLKHKQRIILNRGDVALPIGRLVESDFTVPPGRAVLNISECTIVIQQNGITKKKGLSQPSHSIDGRQFQP